MTIDPSLQDIIDGFYDDERDDYNEEREGDWPDEEELTNRDLLLDTP